MNVKENALLAYQHKKPEWVPSRLGDMDVIFPAGYIERYQGKEIGKDGFGVTWIYEEQTGAPMPDDKNHLLDEISEWRDKVIFPDLEAIDWEKQAEKDLANVHDDRLRMVMNINGPFERIHACLGMIETFCALVEEPEEVQAFAEAITDHKLRMIDKIHKYYQPDVFDMNDDYGMNDRMFMSLETWQEIFKPQLKRIVDACHERGMIYEHHSCGFIEPIVPDMIEIGVDAIDVWQICNTNMRTLKDKYQDVLTFCGGFNCPGVFDKVGATPEEWYKETVRGVELMAPGGSYVAFPITITTNYHDTFLKAMSDIKYKYY